MCKLFLTEIIYIAYIATSSLTYANALSMVWASKLFMENSHAPHYGTISGPHMEKW